MEGNEVQTTVSIGITPSLLEKLDEVAERTGQNRSEFVREAIEALIAETRNTK